MNASEAARAGRAQPSPKVTDSHLTKTAIVYVRQSTPQQVSENRESLDAPVRPRWQRDGFGLATGSRGRHRR